MMTKPVASQELEITRYLSAAQALFDADINPMPTLEAFRSPTQTRDEMLLLHALRNINSLGNMAGIDGVGAAYWHLVRDVTRADVARREGRLSNWHEKRVETSTKLLKAHANRSTSGDGILTAARKFYSNRPGDVALAV